MLNALDRNAERWALLIFYTMLVATMAVEVVRREIFNFSSVWGEEIVRYAFIYLVWIGAASAVRDRAHLRIDVVFKFLPNRLKTVLYIFGDLIMFAVAIVGAYWSFETVLLSWDKESVTDGLRLSRVWFLAAVPIGFALVCFRLLQSLVRDVQDLRKGRDVYEGARLFD